MAGRGGKRAGAGRPVGSKDKAKAAADNRVEELMAGVPDCDSVDPKVRLEAVLKSMPGINGLVLDVCKALMPYVHSKKIDQTITTRSPHDEWLKRRLDQHAEDADVTQVH